MHYLPLNLKISHLFSFFSVLLTHVHTHRHAHRHANMTPVTAWGFKCLVYFPLPISRFTACSCCFRTLSFLFCFCRVYAILAVRGADGSASICPWICNQWLFQPTSRDKLCWKLIEWWFTPIIYFYMKLKQHACLRFYCMVELWNAMRWTCRVKTELPKISSDFTVCRSLEKDDLLFESIKEIW